MGFALFALSSLHLHLPLRRVAQRMRSRPALHSVPGSTDDGPRHTDGTSAAKAPEIAAHPPPPQAHATQAPHAASAAHCAPAAQRPLRVILNRHEGKACRLVISGRMADVCAELERLALH
ncbi:hypothetical protein [Alicycliphilus denitrificans]|uniref:hypothetical protein n=1 Tax=Alicycliphilus denitrificans TaxID=179636 RepID=UPI00384F308B